MTVELRAINPSKLMVLARMLLSSFVFLLTILVAFYKSLNICGMIFLTE